MWLKRWKRKGLRYDKCVRFSLKRRTVDIRSCVHRQGMVVILRSSKRESGFIIGFRIARSHHQIMIYIQLGRGYSLLFFKIFTWCTLFKWLVFCWNCFGLRGGHSLKFKQFMLFTKKKMSVTWFIDNIKTKFLLERLELINMGFIC